MKRAGFTLIEILVAVTIGTVIMGGGLAAYNNFDTKQKVVSGGRELTLALRDVQKRAQSGEKPSDAGCARLDGWKIAWENNTSYKIAAVCDGSELYEEMVKDLPAGSKFTDSFDVMFEVISGAVAGAGMIEVTDSYDENPFVVEVGGGGSVGEVREQQEMLGGTPTPTPLGSPTPSPTPSPEPGSSCDTAVYNCDVYQGKCNILKDPGFCDLADYWCNECYLCGECPAPEPTPTPTPTPTLTPRPSPTPTPICVGSSCYLIWNW